MKKRNIVTGHKKREIKGHGPHVEGYTWHAFPDPATPGVFAGDLPFDPEAPHGPAPSNTNLPKGVVRFWPLRKNATRGFANEIIGNSFLVVTEHLEPPKVATGWFVEEARISPGFELDLEDRERDVVLLRIINTFETEWGPIRHCEFEVDVD
jgi:hypothetical protein